MNHRISITAATFTVAVTAAFTGVLATASPALARGTCTDSSVRCTADATSPYAEPVDALGGRTLAQYVADHQVRDPRTAAFV